MWPNAQIPYTISRRFSDRDRTVIAAAMQVYHERTCIKWVPKNTSNWDYVYIYPGSGCASQVGRAGGMQYISLGVGCLYVGIAQHELMHATGFWHEQSRADRDDYIRILWENIEPGTFAFTSPAIMSACVTRRGSSVDSVIFARDDRRAPFCIHE